MVNIKNGDGIRWPDGKRIAVMFTFDYDVEYLRYSRNGGKMGGFADRSRGEYGVVEGLDRVLAILDRYGVKSTFYVPGAVIDEYPDSVQQIVDAGMEIACHGWFHESDLDMEESEAEDILVRSMERIRSLTGKDPVGHRACFNVTQSFMPDLLARHGFLYSSIMKDRDWAYPYPWEEGQSPLIELPTEHTFDDYTWFFFTFSDPAHRANYPIGYVLDFWKDSFDELASEGDKVLVVKLHPQLIGRASRSVLLERFLQYCLEHDAWVTSCEEVATYVREDVIRRRLQS